MALEYVLLKDANGNTVKVATNYVTAEGVHIPVSGFLLEDGDTYSLIRPGARSVAESLPISSTANTARAGARLTIPTGQRVELKAGGSALADRRALRVQAAPTNAGLLYVGGASVDAVSAYEAIVGNGGVEWFPVGPGIALWVCSDAGVDCHVLVQELS